jgi:hypothetical protein
MRKMPSREKRGRAGHPPKKSFWRNLSIGTVLGIIGLYLTFVNTGADSLRTDIYQPLYREIVGMDIAIHSNNIGTNYSSDVYQTITKNGNLGRIPKPLRSEIIRLYEAEGEARSHILPVAHKISVLVPEQIAKIRTESDDKAWKEKTVAQLNADMASELSQGSFPMASFSFNHTGIGPSVDVRDPAHLKIASPAAITWLVEDWIEFPKDVSHIADIWQNTVYLDFDERSESWYYCLTQDDLTRKHTTLQEFLAPTYQILEKDSDFQQLLLSNETGRELLGKVESSLADRVRQPKQLADLIE